MVGDCCERLFGSKLGDAMEGWMDGGFCEL